MVYFSSSRKYTDEGFILHWSCTEWGEWTELYDGTCREGKRPVRNGTNTTGHLKFRKSMSNCGKFINFKIIRIFNRDIFFRIGANPR